MQLTKAAKSILEPGEIDMRKADAHCSSVKLQPPDQKQTTVRRETQPVATWLPTSTLIMISQEQRRLSDRRHGASRHILTLLTEREREARKHSRKILFFQLRNKLL